VLPLEKATEADMAEWMFRIAYSTGEVRGWQSATTLKSLPSGRAMLGGNAGEVARGYWWREDDTKTTVIEAQRLLALCECPPLHAPLARVRAWLDSVPAADSLQTLDFFFIEQDMGCWAGVWPYAECEPGFMLFPLCHRRVIERMITLPSAYRRSGQLQRDIIAHHWPALMSWSFNQFSGLGRLLFRARGALKKGMSGLSDPQRALSEPREQQQRPVRSARGRPVPDCQ
jgi:hypothetical protein